MKKSNLITLGFIATAFGCLASGTQANALDIITNSTNGHYNNLGNVLDSTDPFFPGPNSFGAADPTVAINSPPGPNLAAAAGALGNWLSDPVNLNANWSNLGSIPLKWDVNTENAIIYTINGAFNNVQASFGVDNGIAVWLNGGFVGAAQQPGGSSLGEHVFNLGNLSAGTNYLQIIREDHGGGTGYSILVTGDEATAVPTPALLPGLISLFGMITRKKGAKNLIQLSQLS